LRACFDRSTFPHFDQSTHLPDDSQLNVPNVVRHLNGSLLPLSSGTEL